MPRRRLEEIEKRDRLIAREIETTVRRNSPEFKERELLLHREQQARWAKEHPDKIARYMDKWEAKNPDYFRQHSRDRYAADPETFKARSRAYYEANKARINAERRAKRAEIAALRKPAKKIQPAILPPSRFN